MLDVWMCVREGAAVCCWVVCVLLRVGACTTGCVCVLAMMKRDAACKQQGVRAARQESASRKSGVSLLQEM